MGFSRQEYWSGLPCPSPGDLPDPEIGPRSHALQADSLPSGATRKSWWTHCLFLGTSSAPQTCLASVTAYWAFLNLSLPTRSLSSCTIATCIKLISPEEVRSGELAKHTVAWFERGWPEVTNIWKLSSLRAQHFQQNHSTWNMAATESVMAEPTCLPN